MVMKNKNTGYTLIGALLVMLAASFWGMDGVVLRPHLYNLDVPIVVFLEHFLAFIFMAGFLIYEIKELKKLDGKDWLSFFWIALFGGAIGTMAITQALFYVNFENLSAIIILQKLQPLFAIVLAVLILKERPGKMFYAWAALALIGSYLITFGFQNPVLAGNKLLVASFLSLLAAFSWGSATVFGKRVMNKVNYRVATYIRFGLTCVVMLAIISILSAVTWKDRFLGFGAVNLGDLKILLIIVFTSGGLATFIYYYGLKRIKASMSTIYELAFPVTAIILDYFINGNVMSPGQFLGAGLVVFSMIMITRPGSDPVDAGSPVPDK